jgi:hypothetical protein
VFSITSDIDHSVNITVDFVDVMDRLKIFDFVFVTAPHNYNNFKMTEPKFARVKSSKCITAEQAMQANDRLETARLFIKNNVNFYVAECDFDKYIHSSLDLEKLTEQELAKLTQQEKELAVR